MLKTRQAYMACKIPNLPLVVLVKLGYIVTAAPEIIPPTFVQSY